ncbi:MAG: OmpA family protein [Bacteroidetes bacterium]|nr:MAG: OmpA family protein [Bacteroidota bacterium]
MKKWFLLAALSLVCAVSSAQQLIMDTLYFDFDSYALRNENKRRLDSLIGEFTAYPAYYIEVYGHTDDIGSEAYNLELSKERARAVTLYLREQGVALERITYDGLGTQQPAGSNDSYEGRNKNRRTDIAVIFSRQAVAPVYAKDSQQVASVPTVVTPPPIDPASITDTFYLSRYEPVNINPDRRSLIIGPQKSQLVIPPDAFATDEAVVSIDFRELYLRRDMILTDMPTISKEGPLEVQGIISFEATANNRPVKVNKETRFEVQVPTTRRDEDMGIYFGTGAGRGGARRPKVAADLPPFNPVKSWTPVEGQLPRYQGQTKSYNFAVTEPGSYSVGRPIYHAFNTDTKDKGITITAKLAGKRFEKGTQVMVVGEVVKTYIPLNKKDVRTYTATRVRFLDEKSKLILIAIQFDEDGNPWLIKRSFSPGDYLTKKKKKGSKSKDVPEIILKGKFRKMTPERLNELLTELNV